MKLIYNILIIIIVGCLITLALEMVSNPNLVIGMPITFIQIQKAFGLFILYFAYYIIVHWKKFLTLFLNL